MTAQTTRLRVLGAVSLTDDPGRELARVLRQPKRFGLLAYLALARPRGFHRRDTLLALFWPEVDEQRGRASLRQSLYVLRRELPDGILVNRGEMEIAIDPERLWCDAHRFESAVADGRYEEALALYRGDLLPGFHVADAAVELDYWIEDERSRLHRLALEAAELAAGSAEARGDLGRATRFAARASLLMPMDEERAVRHAELLHRGGDRARAVYALEQWAERFEREMELPPSPAVLDHLERLRREPIERPRERAAAEPGPNGGMVATPPAPATPPAMEPAVAPEPAPPPTPAPEPAPEPAARRPSVPGRTGWRSRLRGTGGRAAVAVVTAAAAVALVGVLLLSPLEIGWRDGAAAPPAGRLIILPFDYHGAGDGAYLSEGLVYLFSVALDGDEFLSLDPHRAVRLARDRGAGMMDPTLGAALARELGADHFVLGSAVEAGGRLQLTVTLYDVATGRSAADAAAVGGLDDVVGLVDRSAAELLTERFGDGSRATRLGPATTTSLAALKSYLTGERLMRQGRFGEAADAFEAAVAADTLFALAHYRSSQAASWAFQGPRATRSAARALLVADRLPDRERRLIQAQEAYRQGRPLEAAGILRELAALYPEDPSVWHSTGEVLLHFGPLVGWPITEAQEAFTRATMTDQSHPEAFYHLAQITAATGDTAAALDHIARFLAVSPGGARAPQIQTLRIVLDGGQGWDGRLRELARAGDFTVISSAYMVAVNAGRPDLARDVVRLLTQPDRPADARSFGHLLAAALELGLGRSAAARAQLEALRALDPDRADELTALMADAPAGLIDRAEGEALLGRLRTPRLSVPAAGVGTNWDPDIRYGGLPRLYARGRLATWLGRSDEVDVVVEELRRRARDEPLAASLADGFTGLAALTRPEPGETRVLAPVEVGVLSPTMSFPGARYSAALRLEAEGRPRDALRVLESLATFSINDLPWGIPGLAARARLHEAVGEPDSAALLYRRFAALWEAADEAGARDAALARIAAIERVRPSRR